MSDTEIVDSPINRTTIDELTVPQLEAWLIRLRETRTALRVKVDNVSDVSNDTPEQKRERYKKAYDKVLKGFEKLEANIEKLTAEVNKLRAHHMEIS